jgi:hypothetical protein
MKEYGIDIAEKGILNIETVLRVYLALGWPPKMCQNGMH